MATVTKKEPVIDSLTSAVVRKEKVDDGPRVDIFLPELEGEESNGIKVDQYEHVTISNETGDHVTYVKRGEHVSVTVPVFMALKARYPKL